MQITLSRRTEAARSDARWPSKVTVITGGPGTGKTTLLKSVLAALADAGLKPTLAAPTGRAARRLQEATGREAKTIHRLLEYTPETRRLFCASEFPIRTNYLIIDEASMMDVELASSLLSALMPNCALLLVGDRDQLPSVGPGSVLKDVIASGLGAGGRVARGLSAGAREHDRRQCASPQSRRVSRYHQSTPRAISFSSSATRPRTCSQTIKQLVQQRLVGQFGISDPREIQVLTPMNRGPLGTHLLNRELQALLNPSGRELRAGDRMFREGDRVIQLRNNYDKTGVQRIDRPDARDRFGQGRVSVAFEETHAEYDLSDIDELALAYAISVHKSQGSQYPAIVMPIHPTHYLMLRRNLLYTAITRAERVCVLVGTRSALQQAVRNEDERLRFSRLAARLHID